MMVRRRGQTPKPDPAIFLPDDNKSLFSRRDFLVALHHSIAA
jgi:hypothetical protein